MNWYLKKPPYAVQTKTLEISQDRIGHGHWLEPGLGKTGVQLNEVIDFAMQDRIDAAIGFLPFNIMQNWVDEAEIMGFTGTMHKWHDIHCDDPTDTLKKFKKGDVPVGLVNFESMINKPFQGFMDALTKHYDPKRVLVFIDEASRIKNPSSDRSKEALYWGNRVGYKRSLTGSPLTKSPLDLWPQMRFMGGTTMLQYPFRNRYCQMGGFKGRQIIGVREDRQDELSKILSQYTFFGKKSDWTDLPEKIYQKRQVIMTDKQKAAYRDMYEEFLVIVDDQEFEANLVLTQLSKLQQITCGFIKQGDEVVDLCAGKKNPRVEEVKNILDETDGKVLVFCWHHWSIDKLLDELKGWNPAFLRGGMKGREFEAQKAKFKNDPSCRVNIVQISAGGIGLTLLGDNEQIIGAEDEYGNLCYTTIYFENSFDLEHRIQSEDRNHRHGQRRAVTYYDLFSSPIDAKVISALHRKQIMANTILNPEYWH